MPVKINDFKPSRKAFKEFANATDILSMASEKKRLVNYLSLSKHLKLRPTIGLYVNCMCDGKYVRTVHQSTSKQPNIGQCYFSNENDYEKDCMLLNENKNENEWDKTKTE